ncbi:MAG: hypothetical protein HXY49_04840 [Ignavibacteriaceae bacterium]|nr:hypothetical protein [Ignavibacteriaceae bacterium]
MKYLAIFLLFIFHNAAVIGQQVTNWEIFSDMKNIKALQSVGGGVWAASTGGAFFFDPSVQVQNLNDNFKIFTKINGLNTTSLTSIAADENGKVWLGSISGIIDVYDGNTNSFSSILDILNSDKSSKRINQIVTSGDTVIVATDFGVSLIDAENLVFFDTFFKFGDLISNSKVSSAAKFDLIFACTDFGVAVQKPGATNLSAPESWNIFRTQDGLPSNTVRKVVKYKDSVLVSTNKGFAYFTGSSFVQAISQSQNKDIVDVIAVGDSLFYLISNKIYLYYNGQSNEIFNSPISITSLDFNKNILGLLAASKNGIIQISNFNGTNTIYPNGPAANQFPDMTVDINGTLWSASGKDYTGVGIFNFDGNAWYKFDVSNVANFPSNDYYRIRAMADGTIYSGNWGDGFARIKDGKFTFFTYENSPLEGIETDPTFVVITGFGVDSKNNLWVLNYGAADRKILSMLTPDSTWYLFNIPILSGLYIDQNFGLVVDKYDTKWFYSNNSVRTGLFYFNENKTLDNPADDKSGYLSSNNGLNSSNVTALIVDRRGDLWVGSNLGINIISNTNLAVTQNNPQFRITSVFSLRQQTINAIAVDPLNQKWVGTNQGLFLVNSDGTRLLAAFDSKNSPLLSDVIVSIAIDENTGKVYVGTDLGLISFETPYIKPADSFSEIFIYPNPFILKADGKYITIDGLIRDTDIKILSLTGNRIAEFTSPGGRTAFWDGRDMEGNYVASGIYIIVAYDQEGNNIATGKVAVIRD